MSFMRAGNLETLLKRACLRGGVTGIVSVPNTVGLVRSEGSDDGFSWSGVPKSGLGVAKIGARGTAPVTVVCFCNGTGTIEEK